MREIIFRGKRIDNGEWISGNLFIPNQLVKGCFICSETTFVDFYPSFEDGDNLEDFKNNGILLGHFHEIVPETVGQFTGLTDKKGVKIFEGDILKESEHGVFEVIYDQQYAKFKLCCKRFSKSIQFPEWNRGVKMEIIGNIHDHAKL